MKIKSIKNQCKIKRFYIINCNNFKNEICGHNDINRKLHKNLQIPPFLIKYLKSQKHIYIILYNFW